MLTGLASAQHHDADGCHQDDDANDLKGEIVVFEKQKADPVDIIRCRSFGPTQDMRWQPRKRLLSDLKITDDRKNLDD
jgi:hypothetical protein